MPKDINTQHGQNFVREEIKNALMNWYPDVDNDVINDIANEYSVDFEDVLNIYESLKIEKDKERFEELKNDVKDCLKDNFNQFSSTSVNTKAPLFPVFYEKFKKLYFDSNYKEDDVKRAFIELTQDPDQLNLFEIRKMIRKVIIETYIKNTKKTKK